MTKAFIVAVALIAVLAIGAAWYVSGQLGFERGYKPEHIVRADLQVRLNAQRDCLAAVKHHNFQRQSGPYRLGWILAATEDCNRQAGFDYFSRSQLKAYSP